MPAAVLATLTVRRLAPGATVVAAARESRNAGLLKQSGASSVVVSSETTGWLLGLATDSPAAAGVVEDLLSFARTGPGRGGRAARRPPPLRRRVRRGRQPAAA